LRVLAEDAHLPRVARAEPLEDLDGRRLAGAVGAKEAEDLTGPDVEVEPVDRSLGAVALDEPPDANRCHDSIVVASALPMHRLGDGLRVHRSVDPRLTW